jgi:lactate dehydrogenase-like 2-hydroxyacid dehydrogenase
MIEPHCEVHIWEAETPPPRDKLLEELALADGAIVMLTEKMDKETFDAATKLKVLSNYAVGYDNIDVAAAIAHKIPVGNTPGVLTETTADQAFALLMAAARRLVEGVQYIRDGQWQTWYPLQLLGRDIYKATLGIVGLGRIGHALAKRAQGFGMRIIYYGGSNEDYAKETGAKAVDFDTLLKESDFISLHSPLNENTRSLISSRELGLMKNTAILINTARGGVVDSEALLKALQNGDIAYAALDVTDPEPIAADHPLVHLANCIVVPHLGSATWATRERMGILAAENLLAGLRGEPLPHCINPTVYD